jgi:DNA polymerase III alpha subunit
MVAVPEYAELRCISNFTFLRGASRPEELVERAHELGYTALAIVDECSMAGVVRAHVAAKEVGLKLLIGSQFKVAHSVPFTVILLSTNMHGYRARARADRRAALRALLPHRARHRRFAREQGHPLPGPRLGGQLAVCYCLGITEVDPRACQPAVRALHLEGAQRAARHRRRLRAPAARGGDPVHLRQVRPRPRRARRHVISYRPRARCATSARRSASTSPGRRLAKAMSLVGRPQGSCCASALARSGLRSRRRVVARCGSSSPAQLIGFPRHLSQHPAASSSRGPLSRLVPVENAAMPDRTVIQWDKDDLDALGLLKVDVLALGMLSASAARSIIGASSAAGVRHACRTSRRGSADLRDDPARRHVGVFQIESRAQMSRCCRA